jgi:Domain of unknown function (DUF3520)
LIGYENRLLQAEDFKNDRKDAGDIGAGHTVTAFYEIVPAGHVIPGSDVDPSKYQNSTGLTAAAAGPELFTVRLRYKEPHEDVSKPLDVPVVDERKPYASTSEDYRFAASVAEFGMLLRDSKYRGDIDFDEVLEAASTSTGQDRSGYRAEFLQLVQAARSLRPSLRKQTVRPLLGASNSPAPLRETTEKVQMQGGRPLPHTSQEMREPGSRPLDLLLRVLVLCLLVCLLIRPNHSRSRPILEVERTDWQR